MHEVVAFSFCPFLFDLVRVFVVVVVVGRFCWLITPPPRMCIDALVPVLISLFFIILFIIIIHTFILSTIPWNPIGSYNLFTYMCIIQYRWMYGNAMREKKEYRAVRWANKTAHTHTHIGISFSLVDFQLVFIWLVRFHSIFKHQMPHRRGKGMKISNKSREWIECYT